jgi:porin
VNNIEAPSTSKLYEAWIEQDLWDARAAVLVGLYDMNSEFDVTPAASLFLHSSHGVGGELGNSGRNGPSIFPTTSLATRFQLRPSESIYVRAMVADGVPGDLRDPSGTQVVLDEVDGLLLAAEAGFWNRPAQTVHGRAHRQGDALSPVAPREGFTGKYALGVWKYSGEFEDFSRVDGAGKPLRIRGGPGVYALAEERVWSESEHASQGLSAFLRVGFADEDVNPIDRYLGGGLVYHGLFPGRDRDHCGFGIAAARLSEAYRASRGPQWQEWETALELTYLAHLTPWCSVQPSIQHLVNPGGDPALKDATLAGVRLALRF